MKEVYLSAEEAARDLGIEPKVLRFVMQKNIVKSGAVLPPGKKGKQRKYIIYTRKLCEELGIPFKKEERISEEQQEEGKTL